MPMARQPFWLVVTDPVGVFDMQAGVEAVHWMIRTFATIVHVKRLNPADSIGHGNSVLRPRFAGDHRVRSSHYSAGSGSLPSATHARYS